MLTYTINNKDSELTYEVLDVLGFEGEINSSALTVNSVGHNLRNNDEVRFTRYEDGMTLEEFRDVTVLDDNHFVVSGFPDRQVIFSNAYITKFETGFNSSYEIVTNDALVLEFSSPHDFIYPKPFTYINEVINTDYYETEDSYPKRRCVGDVVLFNGLAYLIEDSGISSDNKYIFSSDPSKSLNSHNVVLNYYNDDTFKNETLDNGIVLLTNDGVEDRYKVIFFYDTTNGNDLQVYDSRHLKCAYIATHYPSMFVTTPDERFLIYDENSGITFTKSIDGTDTSYIYKEMGHYRFSIPLADMFATDIMKQESYDIDFITKTEEKNINPILDYEKKAFEPVFYTGNNFNDIDDSKFVSIKEVEFNLHFRERKPDKNGTSKWVTDDTLGWNNYNIVSASTGGLFAKLDYKKSGMTDNDADLLYYLDFTDADVYYQRNKLKKSFIRLSFYDSKDRNTQALQFYSTIFLDSGKMYTKYVTARAKYPDLPSGEYILDVDDPEDEPTTYIQAEYIPDKGNLRECSRFSAKSKYDMTACSEGFYLYLYPSLLEGTQVSKLYMKVEFNHAKYGRIVPFVMPVTVKNSAGQVFPLSAVSESFPINYMNGNTDADAEFDSVDFPKLMNDMYVELGIKYDYLNNRYVWFVPRKRITSIDGGEEEGKLVFNLFEPRVNGYEKIKANIKYDDVIPIDGGEEEGEDLHIFISFSNYTQYSMYFTLKINGTQVFTKNTIDKSVGEEFVVKMTNTDLKVAFGFYPNGSPVNTHVDIVQYSGGNLTSFDMPPHNYYEYKYEGNMSRIMFVDGNGNYWMKYYISWK